MTWILPAGQFDRVDDVVVAGTFHAVESTPVGLFQMFQLIHTGFCDAGGVIFFVFIAYASIGMIISSGAFNGLVAALLRLFKGKARVVIIPVFLTIVGIASSTIGLFEEWFPFIPVFTGIAVAMGFDAIVGLAIVAVGAGMGYAGAMINPFTVGVAQGIAGVAPSVLPPVYDCGGLRPDYPLCAEGPGRPHQEPGLRRHPVRSDERGGRTERPLRHPGNSGAAHPAVRHHRGGHRLSAVRLVLH